MRTAPSSAMGPYVVPFTTTESGVSGSVATALVAPRPIMKDAATIAATAFRVRKTQPSRQVGDLRPLLLYVRKGLSGSNSVKESSVECSRSARSTRTVVAASSAPSSSAHSRQCSASPCRQSEGASVPLKRRRPCAGRRCSGRCTRAPQGADQARDVPGRR